MNFGHPRGETQTDKDRILWEDRNKITRENQNPTIYFINPYALVL
jgi:hypothetical protein